MKYTYTRHCEHPERKEVRHYGAAQPAPAELHDPADLHDPAIQAAAVLAPHVQRVVQEAVELNERLEKLTTFVGGPVCADLDEQDRRLLYRQHAAMTVLAFVLDTRIQRFNLASAVDFEGGEV